MLAGLASIYTASILQLSLPPPKYFIIRAGEVEVCPARNWVTLFGVHTIGGMESKSGQPYLSITIRDPHYSEGKFKCRLAGILQNPTKGNRTTKQNT